MARGFTPKRAPLPDTTLSPKPCLLFSNQGIWPQNLKKARMAMLYKTERIGDMVTVTTRPITILATYRMRARIVTKKMLQHIRPHLPATLFGSVPGRSARDMVPVVQGQLEQALLQDQQLRGISWDFLQSLQHIAQRNPSANKLKTWFG